MTTPHRTRLILRGHQPLAQRDPNISRIYVASEDTHACEKYLLALQAAGLIDPARIEVLPLPTLDGHSTLAAVLQRLFGLRSGLLLPAPAKRGKRAASKRPQARRKAAKRSTAKRSPAKRSTTRRSTAKRAPTRRTTTRRSPPGDAS